MTYRPPGSAIERTMPIPGAVIPAFIHNFTHHFINLPVYADGLVDAWDMLDLPLFTEKLRTGWVTPVVPNGGTLSAYSLGGWKIDEGRWSLDQTGLLDLVKSKIKQLNPDLRNLYDCAGTTTQKIGKVNVSILGMPRPTPVRPKNRAPVPQVALGRSISVFVHSGGEKCLADLRVFDDGSVELGRLPQVRTHSLADVRAMASSGQLTTAVQVNERISIFGLGSFRIAECLWHVETAQVLAEIDDILAELGGRPTSVDRCRTAFAEFRASPTRANKEALREAYESIPEHNRRYVGDMDVKDVPIRMVIYGEEELEFWSHRAVARAQGISPLPSITVPEVLDDES